MVIPPFSTMSVGHETPLKAPNMFWWSKDADLRKLGAAFEILSSVSVTLDLSEKHSICWLKLSSSHCVLLIFEDSDTFTAVAWAGDSWQELLMSHFSASSHLEGKLFLERFLPMLVKLKTGLPGVEGASSLLCCVTKLLPSSLLWAETSRKFLLSALPFGTGNDFTNSEVSLRLSLQSGSGKESTKGLSLLFPYKLMLPSIGGSWITQKKTPPKEEKWMKKHTL